MTSLFSSRLERHGITFPFMIAPMVGLSHVAFRELIQAYTPAGLMPLRFTEMLSTRRVPNERLDSVYELRTAQDEAGFVPQLLGNEERFIRPSVERLSQLHPWGFDINMGCPVSHTLRHNWGVRLMGDPGYAAEVVRITRSCTKLPLSVKLRGGAGDRTDTDYLLQLTQQLEDAGADWLTIHPRARSQGHKGTANWEAAQVVAQARKIPVVVNGDIQTADDAIAALAHWKFDGAMIARAATARPWILWQIAAKLGIDACPIGRTMEELPTTLAMESREHFRALLLFGDLLRKYCPSEEGRLKRMRFFVLNGSKWFMFGHAFWKATTKGKTLYEVCEIIEDYSGRYAHEMHERIEFL